VTPRDDGALAVEDGDHPIGPNRRVLQDLDEAFWKDSHAEDVSNPPVRQADGNVDGNQLPTHCLADEEIGNGGLPGFEYTPDLRKPGEEWERLSERPLRIDELLARGIAQNEDIALQVARRLPGLAVKRGKVTGC
jgi:hypothetical protein